MKYYIIDMRSIVGNSATFWRHEGKGYTTEFTDAGLFDKGHSDRETDIEVPEDIARACVVQHVRVDTLRRVMAERGVPFGNSKAAARKAKRNV